MTNPGISITRIPEPPLSPGLKRPIAASRVEHVQRLLVITYHFPPDGAVGGLRWSGLSKYLARLGWEVHVVTAAVARDEPQVPGVHRHARSRGRTINDVYNSVAGTLRRSRMSGATSVSSVGAPTPSSAGEPNATEPLNARGSRIGRWLTRLVADLRMAGRVALGFPDIGRGWVFRAGLTGRALTKRHAFDAVITSGPPHSAHVAGYIATLGRSIPHVVDMRDPWLGVDPDWTVYGMSSRWIDTLNGPIERLLLRRAHSVVVNTREFASSLRSAKPGLRVSQVCNGTDLESLPVRNADRFDGISIAYAGTIYLGRSFGTLLNALGSLKQNRPAEAKRVTLRIAGDMGTAHAEAFRDQIAKLGLSDMVEFYGVVPRGQALDLLRRSHLALVLAQAQPTLVPAKLYECVGLGVPTLVITESTSAASHEAARIGGMVLGPSDVTGMGQLLDDLVDGRVPETVAATAPISYDMLARQMDTILRGTPA